MPTGSVISTVRVAVDMNPPCVERHCASVLCLVTSRFMIPRFELFQKSITIMISGFYSHIGVGCKTVLYREPKSMNRGNGLAYLKA